MLVVASISTAISATNAQDLQMELHPQRNSQTLEQQQDQYRRKLEALEDLSRSERQWLDRQLRRQRLDQQQSLNRLLPQPRPSSGLSEPAVTPTHPMPQSLQPQRSEELQFKIERESWRYPAGTP